jgi:hypothetical protein
VSTLIISAVLPSLIILSPAILSVIMQSFVMLRVIMPMLSSITLGVGSTKSHGVECCYAECH